MGPNYMIIRQLHGQAGEESSQLNTVVMPCNS